MAGTRFVSNDS